jgi:hypothetical protein
MGLCGIAGGVTAAARSRRRILPIAAAICIVAAGCASENPTSAPPAPTSVTNAPDIAASPSIAPTASAAATASPSTNASSPRLLVLAGPQDGQMDLWTYGRDGTWSAARQLPGATAIGRYRTKLVRAGRDEVESRDISTPMVAGERVRISWPASGPQGAVVAVDTSDAGRTVMAVAGPEDVTFAMADSDGMASLLSPQPSSPFGPSVAWLDDTLLAVLSTDTKMASRLATIDTAGHSARLLAGLSGARLFAISPDRKVLAAATSSGVYVAPVADWLADKAGTKALGVKSDQVVWDLALDGTGTRLAMLAGTVGPDGTVGDAHEIGYELNGRAWMRIFDSSVPFARAAGQVWLP